MLVVQCSSFKTKIWNIYDLLRILKKLDDLDSEMLLESILVHTDLCGIFVLCTEILECLCGAHTMSAIRDQQSVVVGVTHGFESR